jgi:hypothetical protein
LLASFWPFNQQIEERTLLDVGFEVRFKAEKKVKIPKGIGDGSANEV